MSNSFRCATLRFAPALRPQSTLSPRLAQSPLFGHIRSTCAAAGHGRTFASTRLLRDREAEKRSEELSEGARVRDMKRFTSGGPTAQKLENDRPWHREKSSAQPESTSPDPAHGDLSKGRLLTTPTRLLKLILPMPFHPEQEHVNEPIPEEKKDRVESLALLVHPQQPLSYLERLIQAEIPPVNYKGRDKLPDIVFRAEADQEETGVKEGEFSNVASYSGLGHEGPGNHDAKWVRWSGSTEVGDFIRDAARGREFAIDIEGHGKELRVAVPSFRDRTHYMRLRLRRMSREIDSMNKIKAECDNLAHKGAHRLAQGGFAALASWWAIVYYVTFHTEMGWDLVEPVTYLAGLTTIMGGYLWFLYISRDLSYKAAMRVTVSRRQHALYSERGFDPARWEQLVHEANMLRSEIKKVAAEYDVVWDETKDLGSEEVKEILEKERSGKDKSDKKGSVDDGDDGDGEEVEARGAVAPKKSD